MSGVRWCMSYLENQQQQSWSIAWLFVLMIFMTACGASTTSIATSSPSVTSISSPSPTDLPISSPSPTISPASCANVTPLPIPSQLNIPLPAGTIYGGSQGVGAGQILYDFCTPSSTAASITAFMNTALP